MMKKFRALLATALAFALYSCAAPVFAQATGSTPMPFYKGADGQVRGTAGFVYIDPSTGNPGTPGDPVVKGTATFAGGTIATGGTAQAWLAANASRRGFTIQNQSTGDLYIKIGGTATTSYLSLRVPPGVLYESAPQHVSTGAISIVGATTGQSWYGTEF